MIKFWNLGFGILIGIAVTCSLGAFNPQTGLVNEVAELREIVDRINKDFPAENDAGKLKDICSSFNVTKDQPGKVTVNLTCRSINTPNVMCDYLSLSSNPKINSVIIHGVLSDGKKDPASIEAKDHPTRGVSFRFRKPINGSTDIRETYVTMYSPDNDTGGDRKALRKELKLER